MMRWFNASSIKKHCLYGEFTFPVVCIHVAMSARCILHDCVHVTCVHVQWSILCNMDTLGSLSSLSSSLYVLNSYSGTMTKCMHYTDVLKAFYEVATLM